ncbi:MAG: hypothetical protein NVSMB9_30310 [Isosphaeraceae bacterium]
MSSIRLYRLSLLILLALFVLAGVVSRIWTQLAIHLDARAVRQALDAGDYFQAQEPLERWLRARPDEGEAHFQRARMLLGLERPEEILGELEKARALKFSAAPIERIQGILLARAGRYQEAEPLLLRSRTTSSNADPGVEEELTRVFLATYRFGPALDAIDRWIRSAPASAKPYLWRTEVHSRTDADTSVLIADFREALRRDPVLDKARLGLAESLQRGRRYGEAAREYTAYLARHPDDSHALVGAARNHLESGDEEAALRQLDRALKVAPDDPSALNERAGIAVRHEDFAGALPLLDRAIRAEPHDPVLRQRRSLALNRLGRVEEARADLIAARRAREDQERIVEIRRKLIEAPHDPQIQLEAARWMIDHGHLEEGMRWAEKVLREQPNLHEASQLLADSHGRLGHPGLANYYRLLSPTTGRTR